MAVIGNTYPTLLEVSKTFDEQGQPLPLAELLTETLPMLDDIPWFEANSTSGHRLAARTGLPNATWRKLNRGVQPSKSTYADITESFGMLNALGIVDKKLVELSTDQAAFRLNENRGFIEAMGQEFASTLMYGDSETNPEQFLGLAPRFSELAAQNGDQIINAGGSGADLTSIWLIGWGEGSVFGIYPKGTQAGLSHKDMGEELVDDPTSAGAKFPALRDWYDWNGGIAMKDWRNVVRIANVDHNAVTADPDGNTSTNLIDIMVAAIEQMNNIESVRPVFYMPRKLRSYLRRQITNKSNVWLSMDEVAGRRVVAFDGIPVRRLDSILETESTVS